MYDSYLGPIIQNTIQVARHILRLVKLVERLTNGVSGLINLATSPSQPASHRPTSQLATGQQPVSQDGSLVIGSVAGSDNVPRAFRLNAWLVHEPGNASRLNFWRVHEHRSPANVFRLNFSLAQVRVHEHGVLVNACHPSVSRVHEHQSPANVSRPSAWRVHERRSPANAFRRNFWQVHEHGILANAFRLSSCLQIQVRVHEPQPVRLF